jgi:hypothetical protein
VRDHGESFVIEEALRIVAAPPFAGDAVDDQVTEHAERRNQAGDAGMPRGSHARRSLTARFARASPCSKRSSADRELSQIGQAIEHGPGNRVHADLARPLKSYGRPRAAAIRKTPVSGTTA